MDMTFSLSFLRKEMRKVLNCIDESGKPAVLTRNGKRRYVLLGVEQYNQLVRACETTESTRLLEKEGKDTRIIPTAAQTRHCTARSANGKPKNSSADKKSRFELMTPKAGFGSLVRDESLTTRQSRKELSKEVGKLINANDEPKSARKR